MIRHSLLCRDCVYKLIVIRLYNPIYNGYGCIGNENIYTLQFLLCLIQHSRLKYNHEGYIGNEKIYTSTLFQLDILQLDILQADPVYCTIST